VIIDASVAVKLLAPEEHSGIAQDIVLSAQISAPDLLLVEVANAIWSKAKRGEVVKRTSWTKLVPAVISNLTPSIDLMEAALDLAIELGHPVYDCFYLALAIRSDETLITADKRFLNALRGSPHADRVISLADWSPA
jgi:predicted nucleic acid-binding protein